MNKLIYLVILFIVVVLSLFFILLKSQSVVAPSSGLRSALNKAFTLPFTSKFCSLDLYEGDESIARPLLIFHKSEKLNFLYEGDASLGLEYLSEAGIPNLLMEELLYDPNILLIYSLKSSYLGKRIRDKTSDILFADDPTLDSIEQEELRQNEKRFRAGEPSKLPILSPSFVKTLNTPIYVSLVSMLIESNDSYSVATFKLEENIDYDLVTLDAGTEKNTRCKDFSIDGPLIPGCPIDESYDSIYFGEEDTAKISTEVNNKVFRLGEKLSCGNSFDSNLLESIGTLFSSSSSIDVLLEKDIDFSQFVTSNSKSDSSVEVVTLYHSFNEKLDPSSLTTQIFNLFLTKNVDKFVADLSNLDQVFEINTLSNIGSRQLNKFSGSGLVTNYFIEVSKDGELKLFHNETSSNFLINTYNSLFAYEVINLGNGEFGYALPNSLNDISKYSIDSFFRDLE